MHQLWIRLNKQNFTFVIDPELLNFIKISEIETLIQNYWIFIIKCSLAMELVFNPLTFVSLLIRLIIKGSLSIHFVLFPISIIATTILIIKLPFALSHSIKFVSLVSAAKFKEFFNKLRLLLLISFLRYWFWLIYNFLFLKLLLLNRKARLQFNLLIWHKLKLNRLFHRLKTKCSIKMVY